MVVLFATALTLLTFSLGTSGCSLDNTTNIDWNGLTGLWFNTIAIQDPWSDVPKCRMISVTNCTDDAVEFFVDAIPRNETNDVTETYIQKYSFLYDGVYMPEIDPDLGNEKVKITKEHLEGDMSAIEVAKLDDFFMSPVSFKTDYRTYILQEQCRSVTNGEIEKIAWIFTSVHNPTKKDVNQLMELAKKAGVEKELHETDCHETNPSESIVTE